MSIIEMLEQIGIPSPVGVILMTVFLILMVRFFFRAGKPADGAKTDSAAVSGGTQPVSPAAGPASANAEVIAAISGAVNEYQKQK